MDKQPRQINPERATNAETDGDLHKRIREQEDQSFLTITPPFPKNIMIETCNGCNHSCRFCYNREMMRQVGLISPDFMFRILDEAYQLGAREVGLSTTGEALLNPRLFDYVEFAKTRGYSYVYFSTNGARFNDAKIDRLFESGLDSIKFSINAGSNGTYARIHGRNDFDHVIEVIKEIDRRRKAMGTKLKLFATCVVTPECADETDELQRLIGKVVDDLCFIPETGAVGPTNSMNTPLPCTMLFNRIHITWEGFLTCCCVDYENQLIVADLNQVTLAEAWHSQVFKDFRQRHLDNNVDGTLCKVCVTKQMEPYQPLTVVQYNQRKPRKVVNL